MVKALLRRCRPHWPKNSGFIPALLRFFTIRVADHCEVRASDEAIRDFVEKHSGLVGTHILPNLEFPVELAREDLEKTAVKFLSAMNRGGVHPSPHCRQQSLR
jgi:hypothetical protein